ncbi:DUF2917 domain-containing protein [Piscinibacter sp. HJYY11]|uniref:DUF2917 domain-containing protein n=1 Tax=Piscinibacter sp. HJYY11 TaxID=2801333 RepID=UPI00191F19C6|nr:DUF2917 domain-containing protein [Piscinibacter sp. HJYY11]MBL0726957.1 DUF2917 domain-containing protein [Piscinibacter sp. HJYY11]
MQVAITPVTRLQRRQTFQLRARRGERIECQSGELWITQDGDPRDIVLGPRECFTLDRAGTAVVSALKDAAFVYRRSASMVLSPRPAASEAALPVRDCAAAY